MASETDLFGPNETKEQVGCLVQTRRNSRKQLHEKEFSSTCNAQTGVEARAHLRGNHENNSLDEGNGNKSDQAGLRSPESTDHRINERLRKSSTGECLSMRKSVKV